MCKGRWHGNAVTEGLLLRFTLLHPQGARVVGEKVNCPEGTREATLGCADPYNVCAMSPYYTNIAGAS